MELRVDGSSVSSLLDHGESIRMSRQIPEGRFRKVVVFLSNVGRQLEGVSEGGEATHRNPV